MLTQCLETIHQAQKTITDSEAQCLSFPAKTLSDIKQRTGQIVSLVDKALDVCIPSIENDLHLSVQFAPAVVPFFASTEDRPALVTVNLPQPQISLSNGLSSAEHTTASGSGLECYSPNEETQFVIVAKDSQGQPRGAGGDIFVVESKNFELKSSVMDQKNGTYQVSYVAGKSEKKFALSVMLCGRPIRGSPFAIGVACRLIHPYKLSYSSLYSAIGSEATYSALTDNNRATGLGTDVGQSWIQASFKYPVLVSAVETAPYHKNTSVWGCSNGSSGKIEYSLNGTAWVSVGDLCHTCCNVTTLTINPPVTAQFWRLSHSSHLGASRLVFV